MDGWYGAGARIVGIVVWLVTFIGSWIYCTATYGFLLGFGLGWIPSLILATIASFLAALLWPLLALALVAGAVAFVYQAG